MQRLGDPYERLLAAVILRAVKDAQRGDVFALAWLMLEGVLWAGQLDIGARAVVGWFAGLHLEN
jgi:hypothetical protein